MVSGLETFIHRELENFCDNGHEVVIYTTKYIPSKGFEPENIRTVRAVSMESLFGFLGTLFSSPLSSMKIIFEGLSYSSLFEAIMAISWSMSIKSQNIQLIYSTFGDRKLSASYFSSKLTGIPVVVTIHAHEIYAHPNRKIFLKALEHVKKIITISNKNKELLISDSKIPGEKIEVIRLSVDSDFWKKDQITTVLTVARYTPRKGWLELMKAARILSGKNFHFFAVGFGDLDLQKLTIDLEVKNDFTILPKLEAHSLKALMQICDIFCLPSKYTKDEGSEGIPVVLMEAMSMGMPIVTTDDGSITELVSSVVIKNLTPEILAEKLLEVSKKLNKQDFYHEDANRQKVKTLHGKDNSIRLIETFTNVVFEDKKHSLKS